MRYALLTALLIGVLLVSLAGPRGQRHPNTALRLFPDMDEQQMLRPQTASDVFVDGLAARRPVKGTIPVGYSTNPAERLAGEIEFTGDAATGYYRTGRFGDYFGDGFPAELGLTGENAAAFLRRGHERYDIHCAICHGAAGDGQGVAAQPGRVPSVADLRGANFRIGAYPDGRIFHTITHGKKPGLMVGYGDKITVRDRWAIVAYVRALQESGNPESTLAPIREAFASASAQAAAAPAQAAGGAAAGSEGAAPAGGDAPVPAGVEPPALPADAEGSSAGAPDANSVEAGGGSSGDSSLPTPASQTESGQTGAVSAAPLA